MKKILGAAVVKKIIINILVSCLFLSIALPAHGFSDLNQHWAEEDVFLLSARGLVGGYPDGSFRPEAGITRAEFARLLISALNMEDSVWAVEGSQQLFRDVPTHHWAKGYIQLAWELGVVAGYEDRAFRPDQVVSRGEMASILIRALRYVGHGKEEIVFQDKLPEWAEGNIRLAAQWGLVSGFVDGTFQALEPVTRSQAVVFLNRLLAARGSKYELYGKITELKSGKITMEIAGHKTQFALAEGAYFYYQNKLLNLSQAAAKLPVNGFLAFDPAGKIAFVQLAYQEQNNNITIDSFVKKDGVEAGSGLSPLNLMDYPLEEVSQNPQEISDPAFSLEISKEAMGVPALVQETGADGQGQIIAIIDSGVDPGHPDLQQTTRGQDKIIDWANFTNEGKVALQNTISAGSNNLSYEGVSYRLPALKSQSGFLRYGFLDEAEQGVDFNLNGTMDDKFLVIVADSKQFGVYDTVVIDTQGKRNLMGEVELEAYKTKGQHASFLGPHGNIFNLVVSRISPAGDEVLLGYDQLGHGTQVAGVAAAYGKIKGVAPGAKLLVAKVLDGDGMTEWERLGEAIRWAAKQGADVINLSLGYYQDQSAGNNTLTKLVDDLSEKGIIFTIAAGNEGPGIGTLATPGNAKSAISVGGYITPEMWKNDYGYDVSSPTLWYFSSVGPRQDGLMVPTIVAPSSAVSAWPLSSGNGYRLGEGTSIAAPHVAGAIALLLESSVKRGQTIDGGKIKRALAGSGRELIGMNGAEVGYGAFDADRIWRQLWQQETPYPLRGYAYNRRLGFGEGLYSREIMPGDVPYYVLNRGQEDQLLSWRSTADWLKPLFQMTSLPRGGRRELPVEYVLPEQPGIYTGWLEGKLLTSQDPDIRLMTTVIKPYLLNQNNSYRQEFSQRLLAGGHKRYFLKVPSGAATFNLSLSVPNIQGKDYAGRVRFHLNDPSGTSYGMSDWTGLAPEGINRQEWSNIMVEKPAAGIWEVVVYSSASLSTYGRQDSQYHFKAQLTGVGEEEVLSPRRYYLISVVPKPLVPGKSNYVTVHVRDKDTFKPITGMITINGRLYQVNNGQVTLIVVPKKEKLSLEVEL